MAPGISALADALADLADVMVAAPDRERSAASHSISLDRPLRVDTLRPSVYAIDGTPVDCVYLALLHLVPRKPDLCVSGINNGFNLGTDVFYSGTVGAAMEAALRGVAAREPCAAALADLADVMVAAPDRERSAASHSISLDRPLRVDSFGPTCTPSTARRWIACTWRCCTWCRANRTCACQGSTTGSTWARTSSIPGTVGAALEAALRGFPPSPCRSSGRRSQDFAPAAGFARSLVRQVLAQGPDAIEAGSLLNVNLPAGPVRGYAMTSMGERLYRDQVDMREDLRGRAYYWIGGPEEKGRRRSRLGQRGRAFRLGIDNAPQSGPHASPGFATHVRLEPGRVGPRRSGSRRGIVP